MSAGGAMAGMLAATHPDLFAGVAVHSGLAFGAARTMPAATAGDAPAAARTRGARAERRSRRWAPRPGAVPTLVVHGSDRRGRRTRTTASSGRQWLATNRLAGRRHDAGLDRPDAVVRDDAAGRLPVVRRTWTDGSGRVLVEHHAVEGLGHAWSGGARGGSYTDPRGPSASAAI